MKRSLKIIILVAITLFFIFYIYTKIDLSKIGDYDNTFFGTEESKKDVKNTQENVYECSDRFENPDKFEKIISSFKTCKEAVSLALNYECRAGSTMDLYSDSLAGDICRKEFELNNPNSDLQKELNNNLDLCKQIDEGGGTLELSMQSMCSLDALYKAVLKSKE